MIHFEYLSDQEGTGRYGNCASCGKFYNEDPKMIRLTFIRDDSPRGHEICLCNECRKLLCPEVILCRDCVYSHMTYGGECKYCDMWGQMCESGVSLYLEGDFFCGFGERGEPDGSD